ncbi:HEAT repeat domain-containing protein [Anabaena sp. FACHB-1391]|nr:HEAT repeat domain-containing protein [Anabaena sp. FACHB-1391]
MGLVERKKQPKHDHNQNIPPEQGSALYQETEITQKYEHNEFLTQVFHKKDTKKSQGKRITIIGEPGAGKTTLLQKIADYLSRESSESIIIWVSLAELENGKLRDYLDKIWLRNAVERSKISEITKDIKDDFIAQFNQDKVWLLLDGLDEMSTKSVSGNILTDIAGQIQDGGYINQARIVLTCRLNLWDGGNNKLYDFDTYRTLDFSYPEQVEQFINNWFTSQQEAGGMLCKTLKEAGRERIQDLVKNPLRLTLLCLNWQGREAKLPDTQAEFYQQLVDNFNGWKQDEFAQISETQRQKLITDLGKLAREAIDQATSRFRLLDGFVKKFLGDDKLTLALKLGWLNRIGTDIKEKPVYAFFHTSFQEYLAATAINDWDFFLPKTHKNKPIEAQKYRIFEPQWKQTILLWLGREDVDESEKESFIQALINFQDGCVKYQGKGFYGYRAYFLAAGGIAEFKHCSQADKIVKQIINWKFDKSVSNIHDQADVALQETDRQKAIAALVKLINTSQYEDTRRSAAESLGKIDPGNADAIAALVELIKTSEDESTRWQAADSLGEIGVGNADEIAALVELIKTSEDESTRWQAADSLGEIGVGNADEIAALVELIKTSEDESTRWQAADSLGEIGVGNADEIAALVELIKTSEDESTRWQAADSLGEIGVGNADEIAALVELINTSQDEYTRRRAADSLGEIGVGNADEIAALVELINTSEDEYTRRRAANSLGEIGVGNADAIAALVELIKTSEDESTRWQAADSLGKIGVGNADEIAALVELINTSQDEYTRRRAADSLGEIGVGNADAIAALVKLINTSQDKYTRRRAADSLGKIGVGDQPMVIKAMSAYQLTDEHYQLIGKIAQNMLYPEFYQTWHQPSSFTRLFRTVKNIFYIFYSIF